jgi:hypothetical protein
MSRKRKTVTAITFPSLVLKRITFARPVFAWRLFLEKPSKGKGKTTRYPRPFPWDTNRLSPLLEDAFGQEKRLAVSVRKGRERTERQKPIVSLFPRLVVFCLLLSSLSFTPTKRYDSKHEDTRTIFDGDGEHRERLSRLSPKTKEPKERYLCPSNLLFFLLCLRS